MARTPRIRFGYEFLGGTSKRWRDLNTGETISDRKMADLSRQVRIGEHVSKEKFHEGVIEGKYKYKNPKQTEQAVFSRKLRKEIPELADNPDDLAVIVKYNGNGGKERLAGADTSEGFDALDDEEKERFKQLFTSGEYDRDKLRAALGYPKRTRSHSRRHSDRRRDRSRTPQPNRKRTSRKRA